MDLGQISLVVSLINLIVALLAMMTANSAAELVQSVIDKSNLGEDASRLGKLIENLKDANKIVLRFTDPQQTTSPEETLQALTCLRVAENALRTERPISWQADGEQCRKCVGVADDIEKSLLTIQEPDADPSGWVGAKANLQTIIPYLEQEQRLIINRSLVS